MIVIPHTKYCTIVSSFVWTKHRNVTDGQTDRQMCRGCYSGLHCEQCERAVKIVQCCLLPALCRKFLY